MEPEQAVAYQNARMALGSPLPQVTTRLKLQNRGTETLEIEILEVNSDLGNFAVRPAKIRVAPGQTAEPDPMISQLGVTSDEIPVKVTLRKVDDTAQSQILTVISLQPAYKPVPTTKEWAWLRLGISPQACGRGGLCGGTGASRRCRRLLCSRCPPARRARGGCAARS